jgi:hypothetical protein
MSVVSQAGRIDEKDLGPGTRAMTEFDPGAAWPRLAP